MNVEGIDTYAAAFAAIVGGAGVKILEKMMSKRSEQFSEGTKIREELRAEITVLRKEVDDTAKDVDIWRGKYYEQMDENLKLAKQNDSLQLENERLHNQLNIPQTKITEL